MGFPDPERVFGFLYPLHPKRVADIVLSSSDKVYIYNIYIYINIYSEYNQVVTPYIYIYYIYTKFVSSVPTRPPHI